MTALHSAWNPYSILKQSVKRKTDPDQLILAAVNTPFQTLLSIPDQVATERLQNKYLQLEAPQGKESDQRKLELATKEAEQVKRQRGVKRRREAGKETAKDNGLIGRRKRSRRLKHKDGPQESHVVFEAVLPMHQLWIGYMSELLGLSLVVPLSIIPSIENASTSSTSALLPMFPNRSAVDLTNHPSTSDLKINVGVLQGKLVKAELIGCLLLVKRAKNPTLVRLQGIVLQETQGTFKIVTLDSKIKILPKKGSIFTFTLSLSSPKQSPTDINESVKREISFDLFGDAFIFRSSERVGKKFKTAGAGLVALA